LDLSILLRCLILRIANAIRKHTAGADRNIKGQKPELFNDKNSTYFSSGCLVTVSKKAVAHIKSVMTRMLAVMHCLVEQADFIYTRLMIIRVITNAITIISNNLNKPGRLLGIAF